MLRTIGVVGVDATLEEIENILLNDRWGSVYAFLVNEGGETIFHPLLRPSTEVSKHLYTVFVSIATPCDWLEKLAPLSKLTEVNLKPIVICVFPPLAPFACVCSEFILVHFVVSACCDWSEWFIYLFINWLLCFCFWRLSIENCSVNIYQLNMEW